MSNLQHIVANVNSFQGFAQCASRVVYREMAAGRVSPEADFSWLGDNFSKMTSLVFCLLVGDL